MANISSVDSTWTFNPDLTFVDPQPDCEQFIEVFCSTSINDAEWIWTDQDILEMIIPINPWTIGVATFDGLDETGYPHDWSNPSVEDWADALTSNNFFKSERCRRLLILIFFYQAGGERIS